MSPVYYMKPTDKSPVGVPRLFLYLFVCPGQRDLLKQLEGSMHIGKMFCGVASPEAIAKPDAPNRYGSFPYWTGSEVYGA
jgi:hypothetical protein